MERVYINRDCCIAYTILALYTLYNSANREITLNSLADEIKTMTELYTDEIYLLERMDKILKEHGNSLILYRNTKDKNIYEKIFSNYPDVLNFSQLREMLGNASRTSVYQLLKDKKIESFKLGNKYKILKVKAID